MVIPRTVSGTGGAAPLLLIRTVRFLAFLLGEGKIFLKTFFPESVQLRRHQGACVREGKVPTTRPERPLGMHAKTLVLLERSFVCCEKMNFQPRPFSQYWIVHRKNKPGTGLCFALDADEGF